MPLPDHPLTITGGCNCNAIRYTVEIPAKSSRPVYPLEGQATSPQTLMPFICTDHCNDCRRATGSLLPFWLLCPTHMITLSLTPKTSLPDIETDIGGRLPIPSANPISDPASTYFLADKPDTKLTTLQFFTSTPASSLASSNLPTARKFSTRRAFCHRCGTQMFYQAFPTPDFIEFAMLDVCLGTVDRGCLEEEWMRPERQLHWSVGVGWVHEMARKGLLEGGEEVPRHPGSRVNVLVEG